MAVSYIYYNFWWRDAITNVTDFI